ncbi:hypothetical protein N7457_004261 [Penicillium paradoxum]|uniref:uncharacterized protein n=1 Tax=Penicillium paradoxum TaxID=176176 RepID=UPI0025471966|nr:uncharacterized protein N7457_004261 [Penicillium paradoxum]KAJ5782487.1 hypothetical protein N7457_004261 [Penicillium paradoxum]
MSLNGLDTAPVVEAYQSALADAGGWFLLHYVARDEVALHERGTGGVPDIRNAIDGYEECSPLYGFLQYRRRKVIIRYMPEGLSRLILARSNVQFQSVTDKFTPNDTVLALSKASDLTESALSSACLLHTASTSITSSSSSLRRRRLMEITEDAEENGTKDEALTPTSPPQADARSSSRSVTSEATVVPSPIEPSVEPPTSPESEKASADIMPPSSWASTMATASRESPIEPQSASMSPKSVASDHSSSKYRNILDEFPRPSEETRMSTQSSRPSLRELERAAGITPKVKLGPRPSVDSSGRPRTAGGSRNPDQRPVASLPTNIRSSSRSSSLRKEPVDAPRPRSQGSTFATKPTSRVPPVPPLLVPPPSMPISRPQLSPGAKSLGALSSSSGLTPEKERLMKALQQRKKNMAKRAEGTKKKAPEGESKPEKKIVDYDDNKENLIQIHFPDEPELESVETDQLDTHEFPSGDLPVLPESAPESILEFAPEIVEPSQSIAEPSVISELEQSSEPIEAQPEQVADVPVPTLGDRPSSPSGPACDSIVSTESAATPLEIVKTETAQITPEDETRSEPEDSAIPGLAPPTFSANVPLPNEPSDAPPVSEDVPETNLEIPPILHLPTEEPSDQPISTEVPDSIPLPTTPSITPPESTGPETSAPGSVSVSPSPESTPDHPITEKAEPSSLDQRRRVHLEPIQVPTPELSDDENLLSDDSFMEELTSATVQEARPVSVKSPNAGDHSWRNSRAVSSPYSSGSSSAMHTLTVGRSISSSYSENGPSTPVLVAKKINVSSGISSRIKALEKFSSREGTPLGASPIVNGPSASSSFESLRKRASISMPSGHQEPIVLSTMHSAHAPDSFIRAPSVNRHDRRVSVDTTRLANSVPVTARIVRGTDASPASSAIEPSESDVLNLQASPLTVERATTERARPHTSTHETASRLQDRSLSTSSNGSSRPATSRPGSRPSPPSRSRTDETIQSTSSSEEKKVSRTSRLMRRMSSITSTSRRSIIGALSPPVKEDVSTPAFTDRSSEAPGPSSTRTSEPIDIGEVNVQFPETLLWKRRVMRIDEDGYVVLAPATNDATARNMTKRYHLTEFRTPCLPDEDMQELPNSILLEFSDGNTLQCACESRQGQASALQTLIEAHNAHRQ